MPEAGGFAPLLPPGAHSAEVCLGDALAPLLPGEAPLVASAGPRRRWEIRAGRHCARVALAAAGAPPPVLAAPLLPDDHGLPQWPAGWAGSISHSDGRCAAAAVPRRLVASIGVDVERGVPSARAAARICTPAEQAALRALPAAVPWAAVIFSGKESFSKAWRPVMGTRLRFSDVELILDPDGGRFGVRYTRPLGPPAPAPVAAPVAARFAGRFAVDDGWVRTVVVLLPE